MKNKLKQKIVRRNKMAESMYRPNRNTYVKANGMAKWWKIMKNMNRKEKKMNGKRRVGKWNKNFKEREDNRKENGTIGGLDHEINEYKKKRGKHFKR